MGLCQQLAEAGTDEGHLVELGTLVVTGLVAAIRATKRFSWA